jgi:hypothetical protein
MVMKNLIASFNQMPHLHHQATYQNYNENFYQPEFALTE